MAKTRREFILATFALSGIAAIMNFVSLGTEQWVVSESRFTLEGVQSGVSTIKYGLFSGTFQRVLEANKPIHVITMTCSMSNNVCALLCGNTADERMLELDDLYYERHITFNTGCPQVPRKFVPVLPSISKDPGLYANFTHRFLNAGIWVSTIVFLAISATLGVLSCGLAVWNTVANPVNAYLNVFGLYIYNAIAGLSSLMAIILWGIQFGTSTVYNVGILETLTGAMTSEGLANLGFSYWINMVSWLFYVTNIVLLYGRQYLIDKEPNVNVHIEDQAESGIILF